MPVMFPLTSADHGGHSACGACSHGSCGSDCACGCPYAGIAQSDRVAAIAEVEICYPNEWLAFVIPPGEDEFAPERGVLVVHSPDDTEVWAAVQHITHNQVVHVYFNGSFDHYMHWIEAIPDHLT